MASINLPKPGSKLGPCTKCEHRDCEATRREAARTCCYCGKPIGYNRPFYADGIDDPNNPYFHTGCFPS